MPSCLSQRLWHFMCAVCCVMLSRVRLLVTPWAGYHQAPLSTGFPRHEYWSGLPFPFLGTGRWGGRGIFPTQELKLGLLH